MPIYNKGFTTEFWSSAFQNNELRNLRWCNFDVFHLDNLGEHILTCSRRTNTQQEVQIYVSVQHGFWRRMFNSLPLQLHPLLEIQNVYTFFFIRKSKWSKTMDGMVTFSYRKGQIAESSLLIPLRPVLMYYMYTYSNGKLNYVQKQKREWISDEFWSSLSACVESVLD